MKLSVILPVYNVEKYILQCLESIFRQGLDEQDFEVVLVNDGTPDNSIGMVQSFASLHPNVRIIHQENQGVSAARNKGLKHATGDFILFVDPDDLIAGGTLGELLKQSVAGDLDVLVGGYIKKNTSDIESYLRQETVITDGNIVGAIKPEIVEGKFYFVHCYNPGDGYCFVNIYKKEFLYRNNLCFREGVAFTEDTLFTIKVFLNAERVSISSTVFYVYRQHTESVMGTMNTNKLLSLNTVIAEVYSLSRTMRTFPEACVKKTTECAFFLLSIQLWYLSHNYSLIKDRKHVLADLNKKAPHLFFKANPRQLFVSVCYRLIPSLYVYLRFLTATRKY